MCACATRRRGQPKLKDDRGMTAIDYAAYSEEDDPECYMMPCYQRHPETIDLLEQQVHLQVLLREKRKAAFAMGGHPRLGGDSLMAPLDDGLLDMICQIMDEDHASMMTWK